MSPVTPLRPPARVLAVAGSDSGGGAGIQADLATIGAWGGYGMTAVTAVTAQNTQGVQAVHVLPADVVTAQLEAVGADIGVDAVTIGMLGSVPVMHAVADWLEAARPPRVVLDPSWWPRAATASRTPPARTPRRRGPACCPSRTW